MFVVVVKIVLAWPPDCSHAEQQRNHQIWLHRSAADCDYSRTDGIRAGLENGRWLISVLICMFLCSCWQQTVGCFSLLAIMSRRQPSQHRCRVGPAEGGRSISCDIAARLRSQRSSPWGTHLSSINVHLHISPHLKIISWHRSCMKIDAEQSWEIKLGSSQRPHTRKS